MSTKVFSEVTGTVWAIQAVPGQTVAVGETLLVVESMKMEIPVLTELAGTVTEVKVEVGDVVQEGDILAVID